MVVIPHWQDCVADSRNSEPTENTLWAAFKYCLFIIGQRWILGEEMDKLFIYLFLILHHLITSHILTRLANPPPVDQKENRDWRKYDSSEAQDRGCPENL